MNRAHPMRAGISAALFLSALLPGCRKDSPESRHTASVQGNSVSAGELEANQKQAALQFIRLQEKEFRSRLEGTKAGVAKLGNKTRKKLKPNLASLDAKSVRLDSLIRTLPSTPGSEFKPSVAIFNATLDSANAELAQVRKSLK